MIVIILSSLHLKNWYEHLEMDTTNMTLQILRKLDVTVQNIFLNKAQVHGYESGRTTWPLNGDLVFLVDPSVRQPKRQHWSARRGVQLLFLLCV